MILNKCSGLLFILLPVAAFAQQPKPSDSTKVEQLSEVVVTGQFEPQSIKKSVFNVRVITNKDIKNLAANNLADVLNQYLTITARPSTTDGRSTVSLFGLDGQYFKILVDNVPLVNEAGFGNNTDLTQINLDDIEQIEIVEGSMGVTHGANAVSGILNIITKKSSAQKWNIAATVQEETVRDEFELFDKGRHIQALKISHTINNNWFVALGANHNDFQGFLDGMRGKNYFENDGLRGYRWLPKEQLNANGLISYRKSDIKIFYKFEFYDETIDFYNSAVQSGYSAQMGNYRYGMDKRYRTNRYFNNLNATGKLFAQLNFNVSLSHQRQRRDVESYNYNLSSRQEFENKVMKDQSMEVLYSTGTLSNFFRNKIADLQIGYEIVSNKGFARVEVGNGAFEEVSKTLSNYDFFVSSEIKATNKFYVRPGLRFSVQSQFDGQYASSIGLRYLFDKGLEARVSYGNSFRTPTFEELYSSFINDSHFYKGNTDLLTETSTSYEASLKKTMALASGLQISSTLAGSYLDVNDRISSVFLGTFTPTGNIPMYQYINISMYRMWNFSANSQFKKDNWNFNLGAALIGISQKIENGLYASDEDYLYSFNLNANASYSIPKWKTTFSAYYKYTGKTQEFAEGANEYVLATLDATHWLDASVRKTFFKDRLETNIGARNLLDITNVNASRAGEGGAHATSSQRLLAYGRSYFLKLTYNLNL